MLWTDNQETLRAPAFRVLVVQWQHCPSTMQVAKFCGIFSELATCLLGIQKC
jgi:hypothetical protein